MNKSRPVTLAIFPNKVGFGYACVEDQRKLLDYGVTHVRPLFNGRILQQILKKLDYYLPSILVVEDPNCIHNRQGERVQSLIGEIVEQAKTKRLPIFQYTRQQTRDAFEILGAKSKHEIAEKLISWFPDPAERKIPQRNVYMDMHYNTGIFDALSLVIAHNYLTE